MTHRGDAVGRSSRAVALLAGTFVAALLVRAPFALAPGFGLDSDAWLLATSAHRIASEGVWVPSRPPGYPVVEFALAPLVQLGPAVTNLASAGCAALAAALGTLWLGRRGVRWPFAMPIAAVGLPAIALPAASTMDHTFALAFLAGSLVAFDARSPRRACFVAGLLLGLACAARPPIAVVVPAFLARALARDGRGGLLRCALGFAPSALWIAAALSRCTYLPRPLRSDRPMLELQHVVRCAGEGALGTAGLAALAVLLLGPLLVRAMRPRAVGRTSPAAGGAVRRGDTADRRLLGWGLALTAAEFTLFPLEPNYLAPVCLLGGLRLALDAAPGLALAAAVAVNLGGVALPSPEGLVAGPWRKDLWARSAQATRLDEAQRAFRAETRQGVQVVGSDAAALGFLLRDLGGAHSFEPTGEPGVRVLPPRGEQ